MGDNGNDPLGLLDLSKPSVDIKNITIAQTLLLDNQANVSRYKEKGEMFATVGGIKYINNEWAFTEFTNIARADVPCPAESEVGKNIITDQIKKYADDANNMIKGAKRSPNFPTLEYKEVKSEDILGQCKKNYIEAKMPQKPSSDLTRH